MARVERELMMWLSSESVFIHLQESLTSGYADGDPPMVESEIK